MPGNLATMGKLWFPNGMQEISFFCVFASFQQLTESYLLYLDMLK